MIFELCILLIGVLVGAILQQYIIYKGKCSFATWKRNRPFIINNLGEKE